MLWSRSKKWALQATLCAAIGNWATAAIYSVLTLYFVLKSYYVLTYFETDTEANLRENCSEKLYLLYAS